MLEYLITVQTSENIAKIYPLSKSEAERFIKEESKPDEGEEEVPSNPEKRPLRNEFDEDNKDNKDQNNSDENNSNQNSNNSQNNNSNNN